MLGFFWNERCMIWVKLLKPGEIFSGLHYEQQLALLKDIMAQKRSEN